MLKGMDEARLYSIIKGFVVTEKSNLVTKYNTYVFKVLTDANKPEIKAAVEQVFDVKVKSVGTINCKGKVKRTGAHIGRRKDWKKAYVVLMPGQSIDFNESAGE